MPMECMAYLQGIARRYTAAINLLDVQTYQEKEGVPLVIEAHQEKEQKTLGVQVCRRSSHPPTHLPTYHPGE